MDVLLNSGTYKVVLELQPHTALKTNLLTYNILVSLGLFNKNIITKICSG